MMKFLLAFALAISGLLAESFDESYKKIFPNNDDIVETGCKFECRDVAGEYGVQITGFDFVGGKTYCRVFDKTQQDFSFAYQAGRNYPKCQDEWKKLIKKSPNRDTGVSVNSKIAFQESEKDITLSRLLSGLVTLDPAIINKEATAATGNLVLQDGVSTRGQVSGLYSNNGNFIMRMIKWGANYFGYDKELNQNVIEEGKLVSTADGFNKANLAYFNNLFENMKEVYTYLQNLLFVVVGGFFIASLGTRKMQTYLENRGEVSAQSQPYLHRLYIPLLAVGLFFAPIPESGNVNGSQATVVQNIIRYFTKIGNDVADYASAVGAKTYMDKLYSSVGGISDNGESFVRIEIAKQTFTREKATQVFKEKCNAKFQKLSDLGISFYDNPSEELKKKFEELDKNEVSGTKNDITFLACAELQNTIFNSKKEIERNENILDGINKYYSNGKLQKNLNRIDDYIADRERELGWIDATLIPASGLLVEMQYFMQGNYNLQKESMENTTELNKKAIAEKTKKGEQEATNPLDIFGDKVTSYVMGNLAWFILPGADSVHNAIKSIGSNVGALLGFLKVPFLAEIGKMVGETLAFVISFIATPLIMEMVIEKLPVLVLSVSSMIVFISYLVALCKYFYISPFVVAYGLTMKRMDKIVEFLINGIAIFFKPILIVLFIYLALFLHTLIKEFFLFSSLMQFGIFDVVDYSSFALFTTSFIQSLLKIFSYLASTFIMWKLVIKGADWTLDLLGLKGGQDSVVADSISQRLERNVFNS